VAEARRSGSGVRTRFSSTVGQRLVYAAVRLRGGEVLRVAFPEKDLSAWEGPYRRQTLGLSVLAGLLVAALLVHARFRHASELRHLGAAVSAVGRGARPAAPGPLSDEAAELFSSLGELAERNAGRAAAASRDAAVARAVFDHVPAGLLVVAADLSLLDANAEALRLLGAAPGAFRAGSHVLELARDRSVVDLLEAALATGRGGASLAHPSAGPGRTLEAVAVRVDDGEAPGRPAAVAFLREASPAR